MPSFETSEEYVDEPPHEFDEAQSTLTGFPARPSANPPSVQKGLLLCVGFVALGGMGYLAYSTMLGASPGASTPSEEAEEIRVPDHEAAASLAAAEEEVRAKRASDQGEESSEAQAKNDGVIELPEDSTAAHGAPSVQASPGTSHAATPPEEPPAKRLARARQELRIRAALEQEEQSLALRRAALVSQSPIRGFAEAQNRQRRGGASAGGVEGATDEAGDDPSNVVGQLAATLRGAIEARAGAGASAEQSTGQALGMSAARIEDGQSARSESGKLAFFQGGGDQLKASGDVGVTKQRNPYELHMGDVIPGVLISGINSEAPGEIIGQVSVDVYDSTNGNYLLIPQGSRLVGTYNATVSKGQTRVQIAWTRLRLRNGDQVDLGGMSGADQLGVSGFHDRVNRHIGRRIGAALLTTAFTVGYELTAPRSLYGSAVHRGLGESVMQTATDMAQEEAKIPPTLEIRPGYRFNIMVNQDVRFSGPYRGDGLDLAAVSSP